MIARALHALARGLDATADYLEQAAAPPDEVMGRARVEPDHLAQLRRETGQRLNGSPTSLAGITPAPGVTLAVVGIPQAARALRDHHPLRNRPDGPLVGCACGKLRLGEGWSEHAVAAIFDALPTVQGRADAPPPGFLRRSGLEDVDPELVELLRHAGDRWGPLGVALVASTLTDPNVLVARLRHPSSIGIIQPVGSQTTEQPDAHPGHGPGWTSVNAGQLTEFLGRTIVLPHDVENVPHEPVELVSARFEHQHDGNTGPDAVLVTIAGHEHPYMLLPNHQVQVRTR